MARDLVKALSDLKEDEAVAIAQQRLDSGEEALGILKDATHAMEIVGERFSKEDYFIPDLVYSGEILRKISGMVTPQIKGDTIKKHIGKFLLGTVSGDIHDVGKDIVAFMLEVNGFEVIDLGIDVPPEKFVNEIHNSQPDVVGLSGLITLAFDSMGETIDAIKKAGLRETIKIVIGGPQVDEVVMKHTGADGFCRDAMCGVSLAKDWVGVMKSEKNMQ